MALLFRSGPRTPKNFTPRLDVDTVSRSGSTPGLSLYDSREAFGVPGTVKFQIIDTDRLGPSLRAFPDDPDTGGIAGHWCIAPVDELGSVDTMALKEWAESRITGTLHPYTEIVFRAIVREEKGL